MSPACGDPGIVHVLTEFQTRQFGLAAAATKLPPATSLTHAPSTNVRLASIRRPSHDFISRAGFQRCQSLTCATRRAVTGGWLAYPELRSVAIPVRRAVNWRNVLS